ncbi:Lin1244/Lin1753 domain-containing protein [Clostridium sp. D33t1_170424_F3]|uniref:Lin1244/Lin1753 domain-containing protein n=1 Tax=Clostridium sp. D33t1_170424_F3 TaxID=2787099 RepID=UPI0018AC8333
MGRPQKQTADWFPHYAKGTSDSRTKFILEDGWGNDGYAFWFKLLELLCRSNGHCYNCAENGNKRYLVAYMKVDEEKANAILEALVDMGKIDRELWEGAQIIWCQNLVDNLSNMYSKRTVSAPIKPVLGELSGRKLDEIDERGGETGTPPDEADEGAGTPPPTAPKPRRKKPSSLSKKQEERFNRFWHAYPKKVAIGETEKAWAKIDPDDELAEKIIKAVEDAKRLDSRFREPRWTPHPATWLNGREWENEYDTTTQKGGPHDGEDRSDFRPSSGFRPSAGFKPAPGTDE